MDPMGLKDVEKRDFSRKIRYFFKNYFLQRAVASPSLPAVPGGLDHPRELQISVITYQLQIFRVQVPVARGTKR